MSDAASLGKRIADHVTALARAYTAADTARVAASTLDNAALERAADVGDSLEETTRALVEMGPRSHRVERGAPLRPAQPSCSRRCTGASSS
jgi:hypothetical protein